MSTVAASLGDTLTYTADTLDVALSTDADNAVGRGSDGGLLVLASEAAKPALPPRAASPPARGCPRRSPRSR